MSNNNNSHPDTHTTNCQRIQSESEDNISPYSKSINGLSYWFGYSVYEPEKIKNDTRNHKRNLMRNRFILTQSKSNNQNLSYTQNKTPYTLLGQFITSLWFQEVFDIQKDITLYIIECCETYTYETVKDLFMKPKPTTTDFSSSIKYNEYTILVKNNLLQEVYTELVYSEAYPTRQEKTQLEILSYPKNGMKIHLTFTTRLLYKYQYDNTHADNHIILSTPSFTFSWCDT
jgi:hypothetical protein